MATLTRVQHNSTNPGATAASLTATLGSGVTSGNLLVATIVVGTNVGTVTGPAGWQQAGPTESVTGSLQTQLWYLVVGTGGATSFVFSWTGSHSFGWTIDEWSSSTGWQSSPVDSSAGGANSSAVTGVGCGVPSATTQASELWFGVLSWSNSGQTLSGVTSGWTTGDTSSFSGNNTQTSFYQVASSTGTPTLAATISAAEMNAGVVATFKPVSLIAGLASGTGAALQPQAGSVGLPGGTGTALAPTPVVTVNAGLAHAAGGAFNVNYISVASATGTALGPVPVVTAFAGLAHGSGTAGQIPAPAGLAHATGTALSPGPVVSPQAGLASATGTAPNAHAAILRSPLNLGAVLTESTPTSVITEAAFGATFTYQLYGATLGLQNFGATLTGWTMQQGTLTLSEFNDVTVAIAVTNNGAAYNLSGVTLNLLLKTAAGQPDSSALILSSAGGSPAITITNAAGGLATAVIPNTDLQGESYGFFRLDVVSSGLTNTTLYGNIIWITL